MSESEILIVSLAVRIFALGWSIVLWWRVKDWRIAGLAIVLVLMTARQGMNIAAEAGFLSLGAADIGDDMSGLIVGIGALLAVVLVGRLVRDKDRVAAELAAANANLRREMESRSQAQQRLRESERMMATLARNLPGMVYRCRNDADWTMETCSEGCRDLTGYEPDDLIGNRNISYASLIHKDDSEMVWREVQATIRESRPFQLTYRIRTASGDDKWVWEQGCAVPAADGNIHLEGFVTDITERKLAEDQLRQAQKMEVVGQLTGGIAHDFNNLLGIIIGNLELGEELVPEGSHLADQMGRALSAAERGAALTGQLLAFSRKQILQPRVLDFNTHLPRVVSMIQQLLGAKVEIQTVLGGGLWRAKVDPVQLEHALLNLAVNARDAMPRNGRLTIETANVRLDEDYHRINPFVPAGAYVMLAVSDNGCGMPQEILAHAFEPFFTTKGVGKGSGLGLSMVYGFIKQSGGHVKIYSEVGRGTTVKMYFPRTKGAAVPEAEHAQAMGAMGGGETILVVEDDSEMRRVSVENLTAMGYRVLSAADGASALEALRENKDIQLLFTDLVLSGGIDGIEIAGEAKKIAPELKVLFTTGYSYHATLREADFPEGIEILAKPYRRSDLVQKIRHLLDERDKKPE